MTPEQIILKTCLGLKEDENCLIVTDKNKNHIATKLFEISKTFATTELIEIPISDFNGQEPPGWAAEKILDYNVIIIITTNSYSWTESRIKATENKARIASMPGITEDILNRAIDVDYNEMKIRTNKLAGMLDAGEKITITTDAGTDITFNINSRKAYGRNVGLFLKPGDWGNLPGAEAFIAPLEGTANGTYIVDASQAGIGKLQNPIQITVENGIATKIEGQQEAEKFREIIQEVKDKNAYNIAEFGIGTNPKAKVSGIVLEDEKVAGTCHIALGKNSGFGGKINVPFHVDGIISKPTIYLDKNKIMHEGQFTAKLLAE